MAATFNIANGASLSQAVRLGGSLPVGFMMPAAWTPAVITFQMSLDNVTFNDVYTDAGTELTVQAAQGRTILFSNLAQYFGVSSEMYMKIRSGTTGAAVNQGAARVVQLLTTR